MELILNINQYNYEQFLDSKIDIIQIGLDKFCVGYLHTYSLDLLPNIIEKIHSHNKKIYLSMNIISNQETIQNLVNIISQLSSLDIDGFVLSDFGFLQVLKENKLEHKVIFNPVTNITNKYSASIANNFNIHHCCLANELNINDILEISNYTNGNVELLAQGYYQICNSKRLLLTNFFKKYKLKNTSDYYYIKEENRDYAYPIIEIDNDTLIYIDKQRCILPYLKEILKTNIKYLRIDTMFLKDEEIKQHIEVYNNALNNIDNLPSLIDHIESYSNSNLKCLDNISILTKEKKA